MFAFNRGIMSSGVIIDIVLVGIFLIGIIVGLVKGFNKLFMGFLAEVGGLIIAGALCAVVANMLIGIPQIAQLSQTFTGWFSKMEIANIEITSFEELSTLLSVGTLSFLSGQADAIWAKMQELSVSTLGGYLGHVLLKIFASILCFIVILITVRLILKGICALLQKLNKHTVFKVINMILGAVWATAMTYLIVVGIALTGAELVVAKFFESNIPAIQAFVADSAILKLLHNTNIIGSFVSQALSIPLPDIFPVAP